jgi:subtilisin family serine protease
MSRALSIKYTECTSLGVGLVILLLVHIHMQAFAGHDAGNSPNSEEYKKSWGVNHIEADKVVIKNLLNSKYLGKGIKVAILDTGIDYNHPELKTSYKGGYDFVDRDSDPMDTDSLSHGTFIA